MNTPSIWQSIPAWWYLWTIGTVIVSAVIAHFTAMVATARGLQPLPEVVATPQAVWDGWQYTTTMVAEAPRVSRTEALMGHPFGMWVMWLFGSFIGSVVLGMIIGCAIEAVHLVAKYLP